MEQKKFSLRSFLDKLYLGAAYIASLWIAHDTTDHRI